MIYVYHSEIITQNIDMSDIDVIRLFNLRIYL